MQDLWRQKFRFTKKNNSPILDVEKRLSYQREPLEESLLRISDEYNKAASELFVGIMRYTGDYPTLKTWNQTAQDILYSAINNVSLRDELYIQLYKQSNGHPLQYLLVL